VPIIYLVGPDGAGKTTLAKMLAHFIRGRGLKAKLAYIRGTHTLAFILGYLLSITSAFKGRDNPVLKISVPPSFKRAWQFIEFISLIPVFIFKFAVFNALGYYVIGDRSPLDSAIWIALVTNDMHFLTRFEARFLFALTARAYACVYLTAKLEELIERIKNRVDVPRDFLLKQLMIYERLSVYSATIDTTSKSIPTVFNELLKIQALCFRH
jgi:thymidylate kinase